ncbi:MAG: hypothetical protein MUP45_03460 [Candidatus Marinimicrobia bacterium]|nr:hypothetical protein [Candidatus Neomarinimicrobiota bacterium]
MVKIKYFFQRYWFFVMLAFLATMIIGLVLIKPRIRPPTEVAQPATLEPPILNQAKINPGKIAYQLNLTDEPSKVSQKLPVYRVSLQKQFDYSSLVKINLEGEKIVNSSEQAVGYAKGFLEKNQRWNSTLESGEYEVNFFKVGGYEVFQVDNFGNADIIAVHFYPKINKLLVVGVSPFSGLMEVWIGKNAQIQKVKDFLADYDQSYPLDYPLISFDQAWQNLENQKGMIVSLTKQDEVYSPVAVGLNSITITQVFLAYYQPPELPNSLQPIWVFKGFALLQDRTESEVAVYLPAIEETYFMTK